MSVADIIISIHQGEQWVRGGSEVAHLISMYRRLNVLQAAPRTRVADYNARRTLGSVRTDTDHVL
jgi:hypothetical protein